MKRSTVLVIIIVVLAAVAAGEGVVIGRNNKDSAAAKRVAEQRRYLCIDVEGWLAHRPETLIGRADSDAARAIAHEGFAYWTRPELLSACGVDPVPFGPDLERASSAYIDSGSLDGAARLSMRLAYSLNEVQLQSAE